MSIWLSCDSSVQRKNLKVRVYPIVEWMKSPSDDLEQLDLQTRNCLKLSKKLMPGIGRRMVLFELEELKLTSHAWLTSFARRCEEIMCRRQRIRTPVESLLSRRSCQLANQVLQDGELIVRDQQEYLVIGERILTARISFNVVAGNVITFQESFDYLRIANYS
jgi:hypothetical protein